MGGGGVSPPRNCCPHHLVRRKNAIRAADSFRQPVSGDPVAVARKHPRTRRSVGRRARGRHRPAATSDIELGRASCRERVWQYVWISVVAATLKKTNKHKSE